MSDQLQLRRDTLANVQAATPAQGELAFATDTDQLFVGDGATAGGILVGPSFPFVGYKSGRFYTAGASSGASFTVVANTLYAVPFIAYSRATFSKLSLGVATGAAGTNGRIALYTNAASSVAPNALVAGSDSGSFSTATAGLAEVTGLSITLLPGFYWMAALFSGAPTVSGCNSAGALSSILYGASSITANQNDLGYSASQAFGAMPSVFPAGGFVTAGNALPLLGARL